MGEVTEVKMADVYLQLMEVEVIIIWCKREEVTEANEGSLKFLKLEQGEVTEAKMYEGKEIIGTMVSSIKWNG